MMFGFSVAGTAGGRGGEASRVSSSSCREPELDEDVLGSDVVLELSDSWAVSSSKSDVVMIGTVAATGTVGRRIVSTEPLLHLPNRATYMSAPLSRGCFFLSAVETAVGPFGSSIGAGCGGSF